MQYKIKSPSDGLICNDLQCCQHIFLSHKHIWNAESRICNFGAVGYFRFSYPNLTGPNQTWEIGMLSMITRRYVGKREEKITTEYEKQLSLLWPTMFR